MKTILCAIKEEQPWRGGGEVERQREEEEEATLWEGRQGEKKRGKMEKATLWTCPKRALICLKLTNSILEIRWSDWAIPLALLPPVSFSSPPRPHLHHLRAELSKSLIRLLIATPCKEGDINTIQGWVESKMSGRRWRAAKQRGRQADREKRGEGE